MACVSFYLPAVVLYPSPSFHPLSRSGDNGYGEGKEKVLIVEISGIISEEEKRGIAGLSGEPDMVARIKEELKTAAKDKHVKAVILRINSPGGTVTASDMIYHEIEQFKKKQTTRLLPALWIWGHRVVTT